MSYSSPSYARLRSRDFPRLMLCHFNERGWRVTGGFNEAYRMLWGYPKRQSVKYTLAENRDMIRQIVEGFSIEEIAYYHERTPNGVAIQLYRLGIVESSKP